MRYATVFAMYVMQGVPAGFALTAVANRLAAAGVSPPVIGKFVALVGVPWTVQFFWGPIIDRFQGSPMGRRKPWVFFAQIFAFLASLGVLLIHDPAQQVGALMAVFFVHSVFASVQDASVDAMAITVTRPEERARVNAYMRGGLLVGEGVGAAVLATIMSRSGFGAAALVQSFVLLGFTVGTFFIRERRGDALVPWGHRHRAGSSPSDNARVRSLGPAIGTIPSAAPDAAQPFRPHLTMRGILGSLFQGLLAKESIRLFGAILAVYCVASVFIRAFSTHVIQQLHWSDTELSVLSGTYGVAAAAVAIVLTGFIAERVGARRLLMGVIAIIGVYLLAFDLLAPLWPEKSITRAALVIWYTFDPGYSVAAMPVLMALCRDGIEGSQFTAYMALVNMADVAGNYVSGYALTVLPAPVIGLGCGVVVFAAFEAVRRSALGEGYVAVGPIGAEIGVVASAAR